ncbi:hypothetical protein NZD89_07870 [Alicyclobacillus fastidiosus]|uniref:Uncharacterized protein n=1 Tax=Alicyclobacillus fastidiosus TaxID=392011 RepID=A0ABY6ZMF4_9BACL|nr:hypothetical protein [Alicyclobacillus fastidiosus]WAH43301.1 hypothetical protein NZD89_07870 [Alicyclobacillus fastidiosus]GMA65354.1 hypothetical protein GCM10025859_57940 [Alicyclobacillus fastidiosus]
MRLGVNIEYEGRNYDILELPPEAFVHLIPCMSKQQYRRISSRFEEVWPEPTVLRNHLLAFTAEKLGTSVDFLFLYRDAFHFDDEEMERYIECHTKHGHRPS